MNPYLPYFGSKRSVAAEIVRRMPAEAYETYIELFFGSGAVALEKPRARINIFNELDADTLGTHQMVGYEPEAVMAELKRLPVSRLLHDEIRALRCSSAWLRLSGAERAARMIYLHSCGVNAKPDSPLPASPTRPINFKPDLDLRPFAEKLRGAVFECLDWHECLRRYALDQRALVCLIYCDPPFVVADAAAHYRYCFSALDHLLLAHTLTELNQRNGGDRRVQIMVSYDDDDSGFIRSLYRSEFGWRVRTLPVQYRSGHHRVATDELLITNFDLGEKQDAS